jgi:8-oxo-dGTP pyrophosphatase MutT (NUDIX family)
VLLAEPSHQQHGLGVLNLEPVEHRADTPGADNAGVVTQAPDRYPISVKGVVVRDGRVVLLHNERQEWELPGGRLEAGESPAECVAREIAEETGWVVSTGPILDAWMYVIEPLGRSVFIVTYGCHLDAGQERTDPVLSAEHQRIGLFTQEQVPALVMPQGYKDSIAAWYAALREPHCQQ